MQCKCCYTDWSLAFYGEGCGFDSLPATGSFFLPFFSSTSFLAFRTLTALRVYPGVCASVGSVQRVYLAGLLTIDFDNKHSCGRILGYGSRANF